MEFVRQVLLISPIPYLGPAFSTLKFICSSVDQVQASKSQLETLVQSIAQLLQALDGEYRTRRLLQVRTSVALSDLFRLLDEISNFVQKEVLSSFLKLLFNKNRRISQIDSYYAHISTVIESFQVSSLFNANEWQMRNDDARAADERALHKKMCKLEANHQRLRDTLNTPGSSAAAMIVSLQRRLDQRLDGQREQEFFKHVLRFLKTSSGLEVKLQNWMITSYEVEFGPKIGAGGFGQVFIGTWNNTPVALKVIRTETGIPSPMAIRQEIETWSRLRHTHILQFLGANEFDDKPFIVMPHMKNGNARDYVGSHPECDRLRIFHHMSLGLVYLHSQKIVHGDLKALNVLIDSSGKAVLCDFGLSRIKADATSTAANLDGVRVVGSRNWMAPELLLGGSLKKPCDIYAFGMTIYEVFANETPLHHIDPQDFIELVAERDVRPERPDEENAPQLSDAVWELAEKCWLKYPNDRQTASVLCDNISNLLYNTTIMPQNPVIPLLPPVSQPQSMRQPYAFDQAILPHRSTPPPHASRFLDATSVPRQVPESPRSYPTPLPDSKTLPPTLVQSSSNPPPNLTIRGHIGGVYCAAFSPDGKYIASGSLDKTITVWDAQSGSRVLAPLRGHTGCVSGVAFSPNGTQIASSSTDGKVRVWDGRTGDLLLGPLTGHRRWQIGRKGTYISWRDMPAVSVMDKIISSLELKLLGKRVIFGPAMSVAFSADGKKVSSLSSDYSDGHGNIVLWDLTTTEDLPSRSEDEVVRALAVGFTFNHPDNYAISPDGNWLAKRKARPWQRSDNKVVEVFDTKNNELALTISGHTDEINCISFSADSKRIATCSTDKTIRVHTLVV